MKIDQVRKTIIELADDEVEAIVGAGLYLAAEASSEDLANIAPLMRFLEGLDTVAYGESKKD